MSTWGSSRSGARSSQNLAKLALVWTDRRRTEAHGCRNEKKHVSGGESFASLTCALCFVRNESGMRQWIQRNLFWGLISSFPTSRISESISFRQQNTEQTEEASFVHCFGYWLALSSCVAVATAVTLQWMNTTNSMSIATLAPSLASSTNTQQFPLTISQWIMVVRLQDVLGRSQKS